MRRYCVYTERFYNALFRITPEYRTRLNFDLIREGVSIIKQYHKNQWRDCGAPFYSHPLYVAERVVQIFPNENAILTSLLHDVVEDTSLTKQDIEKKFGKAVAYNVSLLTKDPSEEITPVSVLLEEALQEGNMHVLICKTFDIIHNFSTCYNRSINKVCAILFNIVNFLLPCLRRLKFLEIEKEVLELIFYVTSSKIFNSCQKRLLFSVLEQSRLNFSKIRG